MWRARRTLLLACALTILAAACADEDLLPTPTPRAAARVTAGPKAVPTLPSAKAVPVATSKTGSRPPSAESAGRPPTSAPTPRPTQPSILRDAIPFPENLAIILEMGCSACDGWMSSLERVYRDRAGVLRVETILTRPDALAHFIGRPLVDSQSTARALGAPPLGGIVVAQCRAVRCGFEGITQRAEDHVLLRSTDGGVSWSEFAHLPVAFGEWPVAFHEDEIVVFHGGPEGSPPRYTPHFRLIPSNRQFPQPADLEYPFPVLSTRNDLLWHDRNGLFRWRSGRRPPDLGNGSLRAGLIDAIAGPVQAMAYGWYEGEQDGTYMWGSTRFVGVTNEVDIRYVSPGLVWPGAYPIGGDERYFVGTIDRPGFPERAAAAFVVSTGEIQPFTFDGPDRVRVRLIYAAYQGPFARATRSDACTEVRSGPSLAAPALECAASGVLFQRSAPPTVDGAWLGVTTPAGVSGWAEIRYLEW